MHKWRIHPVGIHMEERRAVPEKRKTLILLYFLQCMSVFYVMMAVGECFLSVFELPVSGGHIYFFLMLAIFSCMWAHYSKSWVSYLILVAAYFIFVYLSVDIIKYSCTHLMNSYLMVQNRNMEDQVLLYEEHAVTGQEFAGALVLLIFAAVFLLCRAAAAGKGKLVLLPLLFAPIAAAAAAGVLPSGTSCFGMILAGGIFLALCGQPSIRFAVGNGIAACIFMMLLLVAASNMQPLIMKERNQNKHAYLQIRQEVSSYVSDKVKPLVSKIYWDRNFTIGGVGRGNLKNLASNRSYGKTDLEVTVKRKPEGTLYLKAYVGSVYTGDAWEEQGNLPFDRMTADWKVKNKGLEVFNQPFERIRNSHMNIPEDLVQVDIREGDKGYAYVPYFAQAEKDDIPVEDTYLKERGRGNNTFRFFSSEAVQEAAEDSFTEAAPWWEEYRNFVYEYDLQLPKGLTRLGSLAQQQGSLAEEDVTDFIQGMLWSNTVYDLEPGEKAENTDFAEYFVFDNQKGFCVHYATTAVLLYRMNQIPARYVSGYAVKGTAFHEQKDGTYKAIVTDDMAHAWAEIFDDYRGWVVREHTPGRLGSNQQNTNPPGDSEQAAVKDPEQPIQNPKEPTDISSDDKEKADTNINKDSNTAKAGRESTVFRMLVSVLMGIVCIGIAVAYRRSVYLRKKQTLSCQEMENEDIKELYGFIYDCCVACGMKKTEPLARHTLTLMMEEIPEITQEEWTWAYECVMKAMYSGTASSDDEVLRMQELLSRCSDHVVHQGQSVDTKGNGRR